MACCRRTMRAEEDSPQDVHAQTVVAPASELLAERFRMWSERMTKPHYWCRFGRVLRNLNGREADPFTCGPDAIG